MSLPSIATAGSSKTRKTDHPAKSLTPQRKHRKLLKDGSGTEVWPEGIEKVFVEGTAFSPSLHVSVLNLIDRSPPVLAVTLGDLLSRPKSLAKSVLG